MGQLHELRLRSDAFISNMNVNIALSIEQNAKELVDMNKLQLLVDSRDAENKPLIHAKTGSQYLSLAYARRKKKSKPNLFDTGDFQKDMFMSVDENAMTWFIDSADRKSKFLVEIYGNIFGIFDNIRAKILNFKSFSQLYKIKVLSK